MATAYDLIAPDLTSAFSFGQIVKKISTAMDAVGLVRTSDTGQMVAANGSFTVPATNIMNPGYEIRQFTDGLQSQCPIYMKVQYGRGTAQFSAAAFGMSITLGRGTDGAGNLVGATAGPYTPACYGAQTTPMPCYFSGDGGRFSMLLFNNPTNSSSTAATNQLIVTCFTIDRLRNSVGTPQATGVHSVCISFTSAGRGAQVFPVNSMPYPSNSWFGANNNSMSQPMATNMNNWNYGSYGESLGLYDVYPVMGHLRPPDLNMMLFYYQDWFGCLDRVITVPRYAGNITYVCAGLEFFRQSTSGHPIAGNTLAWSYMIRYD